MFDRLERVAKLIQHEVALILAEDTNDSRVSKITITRVEITRDMHLAKIYYVPSGGEERKEGVAKGLKRAASFIRTELAHRLSMKYTPQLSFRYDTGKEKEESLEGIFDIIKEEHKGHEPEETEGTQE